MNRRLSDEELERHFARIGIDLSPGEREEIGTASAGLACWLARLRRADRGPQTEMAPRYVPPGGEEQ